MEKIIYNSKKAIDMIRKEGLQFFLKKFYIFILIKYNKTISPVYFFICKKFIKNRLHNFSSEKPEEIFDFITNNFLKVFSAMQIDNEFLNLLNIFKKANPKIIMEIGTARGGTLFCFSKLASNDAMIISMDLPEGKFGGGYPEWKMPIYEMFKKEKQQLFLLRANSHLDESAKKIKDILNGKQIDFLFIDGDHTYDGVKKDFDMYSPFVKKGGIIVFHDIAIHPEKSNCFVSVFWDQIKNNYEYREFIENKNQGWCGIGCLFL